MNGYENGEPTLLQKTSLERDLGIQISNNLKSSAQANHAATNANRKLGLLKKTFRFRGVDMWKKLYTAYVRPHLEFAVPVWNPYTEEDINTLEKIQRRATKISHNLKKFKYDQRCDILELTSLKERRVRGDLIQKFKIENKLDVVNWPYEPICGQPRGGHRGHFKREIIKNCAQRYNFFNNRIASEWNKLPNEIIAAKTVNSFKNLLDAYRKDMRSKLPQAVIYC